MTATICIGIGTEGFQVMRNDWSELRSLLKRDGFRFIDAAGWLGITEGAFSHKMTGKRRFQIQELRMVARKLRTSVSELVGDEVYLISDDIMKQIVDSAQRISKTKLPIALSLLKALEDGIKPEPRPDVA